MGEISDMMLDGTLCSSCGEYLGQDPDGFPVQCSSCQEDKEEDTTTQCPVCSKMLKTPAGVDQHIKIKHPERQWVNGRLCK